MNFQFSSDGEFGFRTDGPWPSRRRADSLADRKHTVVKSALLPMIALLAAHGVALAKPARGTHAMVVTDQRYASQVGIHILRSGGNAVDAAVAVGYALAVVDPCCGNIGGGGFMLIRMANGKETFVNFRERAPLRATADMFLGEHGNVVAGRSTKTYLGVGVPGTVAGLEYARVRFGTRSRREVMEPAVALAQKGYVLAKADVEMFDGRLQDFKREPNVSAIFTRHGLGRLPGERLIQPQLAKTLRAIERGGARAFYQGSIAQRIVAASAMHGGILTMRDFSGYRPAEYAPVRCTYRGYEIASAPPPSSGGTTMCEILNVVQPFPLERYGWNSANSVHDVVEAERHAYVDRNTYLGDPLFVTNPVDRLLSAEHAAAIRGAILPDRSTPSKEFSASTVSREETDTTHYSIVDRFGNAVAVTYTINDDFGTGLIAGDTGFFLNNEMDDFTSKPGVANLYGLVQGNANAIAPGKTPLSSMAPTIVTKNGKLSIVAGSPGGSRIITITLGVLQNIIDYGMDVQQAVDAPRVHHQWLPDTVYLERGALQSPAQRRLKLMGYQFTQQDRWGCAEAIQRDDAGTLFGGSDRRRATGAALGY